MLWAALGVLLALLLVGATFGQVEPHSVARILSQSQAAVLLAFLPAFLVQLCDTRGWQLVLLRLGSKPRFRDVFRAQVISKAAMLGLPLGFLVSEPLRPCLLGRLSKIDLPAGVTATAVRKYLLISGEAVVMAIALGLGFGFLQQHSKQLVGFSGLPWVALAAVLTLFGLAQLLGQSVGSGALAQKLCVVATVLLPRALRARMAQASGQFAAVDARCAQAFSASKSGWVAPLGCYVLVWLLEAVETYVILRVVGVDIPLHLVLVAESLLSFLRSVVVILPAGLGVQELGYVLFLQVLGVPAALETGAAFALIKRSKELLWVLLGLGGLYHAKVASLASASHAVQHPIRVSVIPVARDPRVPITAPVS